MSNEKVGTLRAASEVFTHANPANPAKGLEQFREIRGIITQCSVPSDMPSDVLEVGIYNPLLCYRVTDPYTQKQ